MGRGMASHTAWRARVTGRGWGGGGRTGGVGGTQELETQAAPGTLPHSRATSESTQGEFGHCQLRPLPGRQAESPGAGRRCSQLSSLAVIRGGASLQVWERCGAPGPGTQNEPSHWPPGAPSRGVFVPLLPTHLALVSCSCPAPQPLSYPLPTRARNQPWSPLLTLPCLLPGLSKDVPTGGLRAQAFLSCQCSTGLRSLGPSSTTGPPQCRDSQNGQN